MKAWLAVCGVLGGGAAAVAWAYGVASPFDLADEPLVWHALSWPAHPWTLWTAAWVHTSAGSLTGNLLALLALAVVGAALGTGWIDGLALALAWPLTTLALLVWPQVTGYAGLGGAIHAAAAVLGVRLARSAVYRPLALVLFGGLAIKLVAERAWSQPLAFDPSWGINVVHGANLAGTVMGAWCAAVLGWFLAPPRSGAA